MICFSFVFVVWLLWVIIIFVREPEKQIFSTSLIISVDDSLAWQSILMHFNQLINHFLEANDLLLL